VLGGGALLALGLFLDGSVATPWQLYLSYGVLTALGVASAGWVPAVMLVQRWYPHRVGTMLGLTSAGIGLGISLFVPLCQWLIEIVGWRNAFRAVAGLMLLWIAPAAIWLVRDPPRIAPAPPETSGAGDASEPTLRTAMAGRRFWLLAAATLTTSFVNQMLLVHQVAYLIDHGISTFVAASVVSVIGVGSIVAKGAGGWASDSLGRETTYTFGMAMVAASIASLGLLALFPSPLWAYVYGLLVGLGYAVTAPLMPAVISDLYRGRHFGAIFGAIHIANALGGSTGPWVAGRIFDLTGGYAAALSLALVAAALAIVALWSAAPRRARPRGA
jgi:MFS family permease